MHSGRQSGGTPKWFGWQEQTGALPTGRQILFGPHGDGLQGSSTNEGTVGGT